MVLTAASVEEETDGAGPETVRRLDHVPGATPCEILARLGNAPVGEDELLWLLPPGAAPDAAALDRLLEVYDEGVAIAGATEVASLEGTRGHETLHQLRSSGLTVGYRGRLYRNIEPGELDQHQYDHRGDVLAVPASGALIRASDLHATPLAPLRIGWDDALVELCWRLRRRGRAVRLAPRALMIADEHASGAGDASGDAAGTDGSAEPAETGPAAADSTDDRPGASAAATHERAAQIIRTLVMPPLAIALLWTIALPFVTLARMACALIVPTWPAGPGSELRAALRGVASLPGVVRERRLLSRRSSVPRRRLRPLLESPWHTLSQRLARRRDTRAGRLEERRPLVRRGLAGSSDGADASGRGGRVAALCLVLASTVLTALFGLRGTWGGGLLQGGAMPAPASSLAAQLSASRTVPIDSGLGVFTAPDAVQLIAAAGLWPAAVQRAVWALAIPLAAFGAWALLGLITRSSWWRALLALVWAAAPPLQMALTQGRLGEAIAHVLLPYAAAAALYALGTRSRPATGRLAPVGLAGLASAVVVAWAPSLLVPVLAIEILMVLLARGRRLRAVWIAVVTLAPYLPLVPDLVATPRALLGSIGLPLASAPTPADLLMLWPDVSDAHVLALGPIPVLVQRAAPAVLLAFLALISVLISRGPAARVTASGLGVAALGGATAAMSATVAVGVSAAETITGYAGAALSLAALGLVIAAACGAETLVAHRAAASRGLAGLLGVATAAVAAVALVTICVVTPTAGLVSASTSSVLPRIAQDAARSDAASRTLVLNRSDAGISASLTRSDPVPLTDLSTLGAARDAEAALAADNDAAETGVSATVAQLTTEGGAAPSRGLQDLAVGYVVVPGQEKTDDQLRAVLDSSPALEKAITNPTGSLWRVRVSAPAAVITPAASASEGDEPLAAAIAAPIPAEDQIEVTGVGQEVAAGEEPRTLRLSQRADPDTHATLGGTELDPVVVDGWAQGFVVPAGASGELDYGTTTLRDRAAWWAAVVILVIGLLTALSVRRPSGRDAGRPGAPHSADAETAPGAPSRARAGSNETEEDA